ncbi:MAG: hydantoinase/oxoprolinase family protein [Thermomicrobium sp.]|nr:hydantoinase/oxoprolinase family protein [Thermomicrobium sp.]
MVVVGVDAGGTFTDFVVLEGDRIFVRKELSTPDDPARAILHGLAALGVLERLAVLVHGSTVATNAVLERRGACTGLVTTAGFRDVLEIGRQDRPRLYDLRQVKPAPLVPRERRIEVRERLDERGNVLVPLEEQDLQRAIATLRAAGVESVAVCLLFSFANPAHEARAAELLRAAGFWVSASAEIAPEYREYERTSTTVLNAYVGPLMGRYLERLTEALPAGVVVRVMQSNGGAISAPKAAREAVRTLLSGPAAGVIGARAVGRAAGFDRVISFDMGGTSTDVCLIDRVPRERSEGRVGDFDVRLPMLDMHTVGAGGGSIAWFDAGGALRVGPRSAGAVPGPAAYGRGGDEPTVTDAAVVLGWLPPNAFLGGAMELDEERAREVIRYVAGRMGTSLDEAALGIMEVAETTMEGAIRVISVARGEDPREYALVAFGGAGPMVGCRLALKLQIPVVLVPRWPGVLSAWGLVTADLSRDYWRTVMLPANEAEESVVAVLAELTAQAARDLADDGILLRDAVLESMLDVRYSRQSYELTVPFTSGLEAAVREFEAAHERLYGYTIPDEPVTVVNVRLRVIVPSAKSTLEPVVTPDLWAPTPTDERVVTFGSHRQPIRERVPFFSRDDLGPGALLVGPAVISQYDSTVVVPPGWRGVVDGNGTIVLRQRAALAERHGRTRGQ